MDGIFPILGVKKASYDKNLSKCNKDFFIVGTGFFFTNNGYFITAGHAFRYCSQENYIVLEDNIDIIPEIKYYKYLPEDYNEIKEDYIDLAIGKVHREIGNFFALTNFKNVSEDAELQVKGYSKTIIAMEKSVYPFASFKKYNEIGYHNISAKCNDSDVYKIKFNRNSDSVILKNFYSIIYSTVQGDPGGMSGSPVFDKNGFITGIFTSGSNNGNHKYGRGRVLKIEIIIKKINEAINAGIII